MRVGVGYDSHRFDRSRRLVLGGVRIAHDAGLAGHSDADAVAHAVTDAILGAAALGDLGTHFPPHDERWRDADSIALLEHAVGLLEERNYHVVNVDVTVVCESPRLGPYAVAMQERLGGVLRIGPAHVSIKAKSNEGMGWIGRGEGVAVVAVALIDSIDERLARAERMPWESADEPRAAGGSGGAGGAGAPEPGDSGPEPE